MVVTTEASVTAKPFNVMSLLSLENLKKILKIKFILKRLEEFLKERFILRSFTLILPELPDDLRDTASGPLH